MKITILIGALFTMAAVAVPGTDSLKRSFKDVAVAVNGSLTHVLAPCVECPCDGWDGPCHCVPNGCCCT
ncbi:uncharacterized protein K460DRAFT_417250 [Cucurbitaria berberidis CBS 394.84]|uniref:Uncharacterized protein n=1 Tax=Cucurbitaria berberidis CBS 394.84 TaxID=1168544 RepID=A0A9P4GH97_9PLEO|nr:uncharacterized protein K460DRAFT_417250 [Cucurbitaria berberidis CBS 394.84]KAF1846103.1 hypothetical protein K460DRAFT_417250 [Cucurbitaria berberidis CBS 394.84]